MKDPIYSMSENALTIALSADHAGYELKTKLLKWLEEQGYQTLDLGTSSEESVDYPDYGAKMGDAIATAFKTRLSVPMRRHLKGRVCAPARLWELSTTSFCSLSCPI